MVTALDHNQEEVGLIPMQPFQFRARTSQGVRAFASIKQYNLVVTTGLIDRNSS